MYQTIQITFSHCFLDLEWNLTSISDSITKSNIDHIEWMGDALICYFTKKKEYQKGKNVKIHGILILILLKYRLIPVITPSKYLFSEIFLWNGTIIFPSVSQYIRFVEFFNAVIENNKNKFSTLVIQLEEFSCH